MDIYTTKYIGLQIIWLLADLFFFFFHSSRIILELLVIKL
jgi:hypothetical protein